MLSFEIPVSLKLNLHFFENRSNLAGLLAYMQHLHQIKQEKENLSLRKIASGYLAYLERSSARSLDAPSKTINGRIIYNAIAILSMRSIP